jgi:hypothetical protein
MYLCERVSQLDPAREKNETKRNETGRAGERVKKKTTHFRSFTANPFVLSSKPFIFHKSCQLSALSFSTLERPIAFKKSLGVVIDPAQGTVVSTQKITKESSSMEGD